jgi:hypothetical protein
MCGLHVSDPTGEDLIPLQVREREGCREKKISFRKTYMNRNVRKS